MEACKVFPLHFGIDTLHKANIFESGNMCIIDCNISYLTPYHDWEKVLNLKFTGSVFDFPTNNLSLYYCAFCWANSWCFVIDISRTIHWKQFEHDPYASTENYSFLLQSSGFCLNTAFSWSGNIWSIWKCNLLPQCHMDAAYTFLSLDLTILDSSESARNDHQLLPNCHLDSAWSLLSLILTIRGPSGSAWTDLQLLPKHLLDSARTLLSLDLITTLCSMFWTV